jgi:hypothetical protein
MTTGHQGMQVSCPLAERVLAPLCFFSRQRHKRSEALFFSAQGLKSRRTISASGTYVLNCSGSCIAHRVKPSRQALTTATSWSGSPGATSPVAWPSTKKLSHRRQQHLIAFAEQFTYLLRYCIRIEGMSKQLMSLK